jgi:hypothetical protein
MSERGERNTIIKETNIPRAELTAMHKQLDFTNLIFSVAIAKPKEIIGPIRGEINIAPIIAAEEFVSSPRIAIPDEIIVKNAILQLKTPSIAILSIISL